ncbi:M67 family metallopeptidase [Bacillus sp. J37]|uniref:Mov34/MPN/PAD-1 family protein n=1 Tax=Bacillus sp. J37 TaxID=935837 RepID=UPI00047E9CD8|nr:M67 family metallopeptidase [Bacillus sp. J37]
MSNNKLTLKQNDYEKIIDHCCSEQPYEACGIVSGVNDIVSSIWKLKNESKSLNRYFVSNEKVQNVFDEIFNKGENVLGIYHSHPKTSPIPSEFDLINHPYHDVKMIIISLKKKKPVIKCYEIVNKSFFETTLIVN